MANNRNYSPNTQETLRPSPSTSNNRPTFIKPGTRGDVNLIKDTFGNIVSQMPKELEGEIIELQKRHYDQASTSELLDRGFSEIAKTKDKLTTDNFFSLYQELFYDLPKQGKKSHTYLIEESTKYIGGYEDPKDDKIDILLDKLTEIETAQIQTPSEHPLFRNGTAVRSNTSLGIMQEGRLRRVSNGGNPSPYSQLKKTLGLKDEKGKPLSDEDSWTRVTEQTWASLPKWPSGTMIDEVADWSLTLSQFEVAVSNITVLKQNVRQSELDQAEINFLIKELESKTPYLGNTLEDNFNGTLEYGPTDLLPFTNPGNSQGQTKIFYKGGEYGDAKALFPMAVMNSIIEKHEATDSKGIYGLKTNIYPNRFDTGHFSRGEKNLEEQRRQELRNKYTEDVGKTAAIGAFIGSILAPGVGTAIGGYLGALGGSYSSDGQIIFDPYPEKNERYGNDWKSECVEELTDLMEEINNGNFVKYVWSLDSIRSFDGTTLDGITLSTGQLFWVEGGTETYNLWASQKVKKAIEDYKAKYGNYTALSKIEDDAKGYMY